MKSFPLFLSLQDQDIAILGANEAARNKIRLLLKTEARLHIYVPCQASVHEDIQKWASDQRVQLHHNQQPDDLRNLLKDSRHFRLVVIASDDDLPLSLAKQIYDQAEARGLPINVIDHKPLCSVTFPALVDRDPVVIAIGTEGTSPVLAQRIRLSLESYLPASLGPLADFADRFRQMVMQLVTNAQQRRRFWHKIFDGPIADKIALGKTQEAQNDMIRLLNQDGSLAQAASPLFGEDQISPGSIALVGAGPGDPEELTLKALRLLSQADVVLYDRLVSPAILDRVRRDADLICVGKTANGPSWSQQEIHAEMIKQARTGANVVRLHGGDALIFGRGGEELRALKAAGLEAEIVPGISTAISAAARLQIPLTDRDGNSELLIRPGRYRNDGGDHVSRPPMQAIYMGVAQAKSLQEQFYREGYDAQTPIAIMQWVGWPQERCLKTDLGTFCDDIDTYQIQAPAMILIGENVNLATAPLQSTAAPSRAVANTSYSAYSDPAYDVTLSMTDLPSLRNA